MLNLSTKESRILPWIVEVRIPHYEFYAFKKTFPKILAIAEHGKQEITCPDCGGKNVEQRSSAFSAITAKKNA